MNRVSAKKVVRLFESRGIRVLVVGGLALEVAGVGGTSDVDLFVTVRDFEELPRELRAEKRVAVLLSSGDDEVRSGLLRAIEGDVRFDVLDPSVFSGKKSGDEFFDYVEKHFSFESEIGPTVRPPVVWYTRLLLPGEDQLGKIARDLGNGADPTWLNGAVRIARRFGTEGTVKARLRRLAELRRVLGGV